MSNWNVSINLFSRDAHESSYSVRMWQRDTKWGWRKPQKQWTGRIVTLGYSDPRRALQTMIDGMLRDL